MIRHLCGWNIGLLHFDLTFIPNQFVFYINDGPLLVTGNVNDGYKGFHRGPEGLAVLLRNGQIELDARTIIYTG